MVEAQERDSEQPQAEQEAAIPDPQQEQAEFERQERRVRQVLDRLARLQTGSFGRKGAVYAVSPWEWKIAMEWALQRIGTVGATVLEQRLRRDRSFIVIARTLAITNEESVLMYQVSLLFFLGELDKLNRLGIPDDYTEQVAA